MNKAKLLCVILPAYNEAPVIASVLKTIPRNINGVETVRVIVVNDGSTDDTKKQVQSVKNVILANHSINLGAGAATMTGLAIAKKMNANIAVTIDADGQHLPSDIKYLIKPILDGQADIVIGNRFLKKQNIPKPRIFLNKLANLLTNVLYQTKISDSQSGFRAYSNGALQRLQIDLNGFEACSELVWQSKKHNLQIKEIPVNVRYTKYSLSKGQNASNALFMGLNLIFKSLRRIK